MITNLFSTFDPCTGNFSLNWIRTVIIFFILPQKYWLVGNKRIFIINNVIITLHKEIKLIIPYKGSTLIIMRIFLIIIYNNIIGLLPYIFTSSSHLIFSLSLALPIWLSFIIYGWLNKTNIIFTHLVPSGTPGVLIPFIVLIETIRNFIRPGSLAVRLTANIIAGHLLISLLGGNSIHSFSLLLLTMSIFILLIIFELAVALIQSYVFITLTTLYSREV